jgi:hypothetical protein
VAHYNAKIISELPSFDKDKLQAIWRDLYRQPAPAALRREWLVRILAYRIQEDLYGGLKPQTKKKLLEWGRLFDKDPNAKLAHIPIYKPGTQLIRQWQGEHHVVTVAFDGSYLYRQKSYKSLSEIARVITRTRWSGPLFFGLKGKREKQRG